jgi:4-amino-4-deoxy-L-arabinose transferase-like glycosyltransferase
MLFFRRIRKMLNHIKSLSLWHIILCCFIVRIVIALISYHNAGDVSIFYQPDSITYITPAREILKTGNFTTEGSPEILRTPGYPIFLLPGVALGKVEIVTIFLQIIISCLTALLIYKSSYIIFENSRAALIGAALYSFDPLSAHYSVLMLTEATFTFSIMVFFYFLLLYLKRGGFRNLTVSAIFLVGSVYIRPISYYLPLFVSLCIFVYFIIHNKSFSRAIVPSFLFLLLCMGLIFIWQARNNALTGYSGFSAITDYNIYNYHAAAIIAKKKNIPVYEQRNAFLKEADKHSSTNVERYSYMRREGKRIILANKKQFVMIFVKGIASIQTDPGGVDFYKILANNAKIPSLVRIILYKVKRWESVAALVRNPYGLFITIWSTIYVLIGLSSYVAFISPRSGIRGNPYLFIVFVVVFYFIIISGGPASYDRFRYPIMPILCLLAGILIVTPKAPPKDEPASRLASEQ